MCASPIRGTQRPVVTSYERKLSKIARLQETTFRLESFRVLKAQLLCAGNGSARLSSAAKLSSSHVEPLRTLLGAIAWGDA